jgi:quercetin dioxygenase-like cupin family protein/DNA-binding XRE family transcriptional regulator
MKNQRQDIAIRIRGLREAADMPLEEAARGLGMTPADYARCETGEADASLGLISKIAALFKVDAAALLTGGDSHARVFSVTRRGTGPVVERRQDYHYESLGGGYSKRALEPFLVTVQPKPEAELHLNTHPGQEFNRVTKGRLKLVIDGHAVILKSGDSIYFDSTRPHGMQALDGKPAQFLAVITA